MKKIIRSSVLFLFALCVFVACTADKARLSQSVTQDSRESESTTETPSAQPLTEDIVASTEAHTENNEPLVVTGENTGTDKTVTGLEPLERVEYTVSDPQNERGLSNEKVCHSHGPAAEGKPHHTVVEFQKHFEKFGAFTLDTVSTEKVLYLTFDCGYEHDGLTGRILDTLKEKQVPAAFFCTLHHIKDQPQLIARMIAEGHTVGNHSANHPSFPDISREKMAAEIEECENCLRENFGYASRFFRFPAGEYSDSALDAVQSLGYVSVFWSVAYSDWDVNSPKGKDYAVRTVTERLHPGAVILLHSVSKDNADALGEIIDKARSEGYEFKPLEAYKSK